MPISIPKAAPKEEGKKDASVQRYKGLGEMNAEQLWETTMNPLNRTMGQVTLEDVFIGLTGRELRE